ncbi:DUF5686 and carboxypeptidase regulatory-like domain-containing protein [Flavobacterium sp. 7A]|uniref:DUF5686 and carboxypeptidase regulatory-like domain-containing protein n=1 Tax=Flavobacterium sp. 7A TaxID=2940571 RepID=UPI002226619B|nr:DUF5686 and carboxypeptidase regulatory-like domain-containing protein [Flavobacterium sp. 7A]MCW2119164.1 hypothetical protein [Flavobacterium sp. 7A]
MKYIFLFLLLTSLTLQAQFQVNGIVKDIETNKALPFATLTFDKNHKTITDVDGKFAFKTTTDYPIFETTYLGYSNTKNDLSIGLNFYPIYLTPNTTALQKATIFNNNPATAIIKQAIALKKANNPKNNLTSFEFKSYNKLLVSAHPDSIIGTLDSVFIQRRRGLVFKKIDSTKFKFKEAITKHHLFITEKVSHFQFKDNSLKETILGTKMAGLKQPLYEIIGFNLQSFSVYDEKYELFETKYKSPISRNAPKEYSYKLLDTVNIGGRMTYMIHFKNKKISKTAGLEGILYIDQKSYAVAKAVMRIKGVLDISGTHEFEYVPEQKMWFPISKKFKIVKGKNDDDIKILGGTIQFDGDFDDNLSTREKQPSDYVYLSSQTNNFDFRYNKPVTVKKSFVSIEIKDNALNKPVDFWNKYRKDSLDLREKKTYFVLDTFFQKKRLESKIRFGRKIINGYLPLPFFDMDLRKLVRYNNYEGFRLGFGGVTNERMSKIFKIDAYAAYGTKDGAFKYHFGASVRVGKFSNSWIGADYTDDVREIASTTFAIDKVPFKLYDPRPINISTFYNYVSWRTYIETAIIPKTESIWELSHSEILPKFNYAYNLHNHLYTNYQMTTAKVSLQWNPFSDYMQTPNGRIEIEKRYPKFTFQITQSLPKAVLTDFQFTKIDFKTEYEKKYLNGQKTNLLFQGGYALGDVPLTHLYNTSPNNITKETIVQRITFAGKNSFETMYFNEFFSSEFAYFQFKHSLNRLKLFSKIKPSLVLVSRMAWGNLQKPEQHVGIEYKTLNKGYFESGIELNQILNGLGLTAFYRYGPNQLPKFEDNIAVKLSFVLNIGL